LFGSSRPQSSERTAAERERAREERARLRASRNPGSAGSAELAHGREVHGHESNSLPVPDLLLADDRQVVRDPDPLNVDEHPGAPETGEKPAAPDTLPRDDAAHVVEPDEAPQAVDPSQASIVDDTSSTEHLATAQEASSPREDPDAALEATEAGPTTDDREGELEAFPPTAEEPRFSPPEETAEYEHHFEEMLDREPEADATVHLVDSSPQSPERGDLDHEGDEAEADEEEGVEEPLSEGAAGIPVGVKLPPRVQPPERIPPLPPAPVASGRRAKRSTRRGGRSREAGRDLAASSRLGSTRSPRHAGGSKPRRTGRSIAARVGASLALVVAIAVVWFVISLFQPFSGSAGSAVIVTIPKGSSSGQIGSILARDGVVSSGFFFEARALIEGKRGDLRSGRFQMRHGMSYAAAIDTLSKPPPRVIAVTLTIPEGETRRQIAEIAHAKTISGSYLLASQSSSTLDPSHYGAPSHTHDLEGFLFPATYDLHAGAPATELVAQQLLAFRRRFGNVEIRRARELGVSPYELLTIASMVEREAEVSRDRPLVAAVIYNRLRLGMTLGIDATIRYALNDYSAPLTEAQLHINSPYNTRIHHGLPPTPISNPGLASIDAAAHPAHVSYLYYVAAADGCGEQVFSTEYAQFERNAAAYQQALAKNHGRVPTCRKK
jgi:UPF0755 protein